MRILGINKGETWFGKELRDGGVAIIENNKLRIAVAEERVSRQKGAGGFSHSLVRVLDSLNISIHDFDAVMVSTCCESEEKARKVPLIEDHKNVLTVNHHISHAYNAFFQSTFDKALIVVVDGGGNTFSDTDSEYWWRLPREQHSYFLADGQSLELVDRDFFQPEEVGFGELYRAFTHYLGFTSASFASRTMALAAFGNRQRFGEHLCIQFRDGRLSVPIRNDPNNPIGMVRSLSRVLGLDFGEPRDPSEEILPIHKDLAAYVQMCVEEALLRKLRWLQKMYTSTNLCLGGGFFLNCVANGRILKERFFENVYVPSAPGDTGQAIGNAIFGAISLRGNTASLSFTNKKSEDVALGPMQTVDYDSLTQLLVNTGLHDYILFQPQNLPRVVASLLSIGVSTAIFQGSSEVGPRALGHRSILADPRNEHIRNYLNGVKSREWFMTFAPVILSDSTREFFEVHVDSPFMSFAMPCNQDARRIIPAVISNDGTSRIQTVDRAADTFMSNVINEFESINGIPILLNTSFNHAGEPIVETAADAIRSFSQMPVNVLVLNDFFIAKKLMPEMINIGLLSSSLYDIPLKIHDRRRVETKKEVATLYELVRWIQEMTGRLVCVRYYLPLYKEYIRLVDADKKQTTTRFRKYSVEVPADTLLPLVQTDDFGKAKTDEVARWARITGITYKRFGEITESDARRDGFESVSAMRDRFTRDIYPGLGDEDWVTIYSMHWAAKEEQPRLSEK